MGNNAAKARALKFDHEVTPHPETAGQPARLNSHSA